MATLDQARRILLFDELLRRFGGSLRGIQLYASNHPLVTRNIQGLCDTIRAIQAHEAPTAIGVVGDELVVADVPMPKASSSMGELIRRLKVLGVERITIDRGVSNEEMAAFIQRLGTIDPIALKEAAARGNPDILSQPHIRVGRIQIEQRVEEDLSDTATIRKLYAEAVNMASAVWESARSDSKPDTEAARGMVNGLAQAVSQNRTALLALTALKNYDNYTFTHMVNVSILTMGQARGLGIEGPLLREFGLAALMHDIGKVRTPPEVLNKPDKLTDEEFTIMKRHVVDGAEILRRTPEMPALAPVVAFEHHLRLDGTGYPDRVSRPTLNVATMMCSIADVYDAMRSQRRYQQAFPTDRILAVLQRNDGKQFEQHLVRRFVQLVGIYPAGNLVRLNTDEIAVVLRVHAPDPYRPRVRLLIDREGNRLELPIDLNLWEVEPDSGRGSTIVAPVDPAQYEIDPLNYM
ncbi:MAG TPA: HD domain-containing phosphohydrolase [Vicinamibacterales bacterium]|jgi:putative nucleotidyltransferase with HDIG domain